MYTFAYKLWIAGLFALVGFSLQAQPFTTLNAGLVDFETGTASWGDMDNDGDIDVLLTGGGSGPPQTEVYENNGGTFTALTGTGLPPMGLGAADWGDYDNDGDLDILITGRILPIYVSRIYRNNGNGTFTDINAGLMGVGYSAVDWGDMDNDGDLDFVLTGEDVNGVPRSKIYRNNGNGTFTDLGIALIQVERSDAAWGDMDNDGDLDLALSGEDINGDPVSKIYRNNGNGTFTDLGAGLTPVKNSAMAWGDMDNDGDLDIVLAGHNAGGTLIGQVYRNNGNSTFSTITNLPLTIGGIPITFVGDVAWGDADADGDLDLTVGGFGSILYRGDGLGGFVEAGSFFYASSVAWGDYDNDQDLDLLIGGDSDVYRNDVAASNTAPGMPSNLSGSMVATTATLSWDAATDAETASPGLTYNLRVGTTPGGFDVLAPMSAVNTGGAGKQVGIGYRKVPRMGNAGPNTSWTLEGLTPGTVYYWSVQAVDHNFTGSDFAAEGTFPPQLFTDISAGLTPVSNSAVDWGDYDNDGDLDILMTGNTNPFTFAYTSKIYRNDAGTFVDIGANLADVSDGSVAWGDYDNDGDLDALLTGKWVDGPDVVRTSNLYRNDAGTFIFVSSGLADVEDSSVDWGDMDNDGDLDILLTGNDGNSHFTGVYRNDGGSGFTEVGASIVYVSGGSGKWGDMDNDGDLDFLIAGQSASGAIARVYRNDGLGGFVYAWNLGALSQADVAWGDYNNDGWLDILITGHNGINPELKLFKNDQDGSFTEVTSTGLDAVQNGSIAWGDMDNDGDLDVLLTGDDSSDDVARVYRNNGDDTFSDSGTLLTGVQHSAAAWGDYDNDGDLDILLTGLDINNNRITKIYSNNALISNTVPNAPDNLVTSSITKTSATLSWDPATDNETAAPGLTYNLSVGTTPGGFDVLAPMSAVDATGTGKTVTPGYRKVPRAGNTRHNTTWVLKELTPGETYHWRVQAIDPAFSGSAFGTGGSFTTQACVTVNVKVWLHGAHENEDRMRTDLRSLADFPLTQPYNTPPWNYTGTETLSHVSAATVDWVLVHLRETPDGPNLATRASLLRRSGDIRDLVGGSQGLTFDGVAEGDYYIVVDHRNHLPVMSATAQTLTAESSTYDFTTASTQAYGINPMTGAGAAGGPPFALWGGDGDRSHAVTSFDFLNVWLPDNGGSAGYTYSDFNMDTQATAFDFLQAWLPSNGQSSQVPD